MADDLQAQLMAQASLLQSSQGGGGKASALLALCGLGNGRDVDVFSSMSLKGKGLNFEKTAPIVSFGKQGGLLATLCKDLKGEGIMAGLKKVADAGAPRQVSSLTEITGQSHGLGRTGGGSDIALT